MVGHKPPPPLRCPALDSPLLEPPRQLRRIIRGNVGVHKIGVDPVRVDGYPRHPGPSQGQLPGIGVVLGQPFDHGLERDDAGRGDDTGLPHFTTEGLAIPPGRVNELIAATQERPGGRS